LVSLHIIGVEGSWPVYKMSLTALGVVKTACTLKALPRLCISLIEWTQTLSPCST